MITGRESLIALSVVNGGDYQRITESVKRRKCPTDEVIISICKSIKSKVTTILDPDYPSILRLSCPRPPYVLFYYGDISLAGDYERVLAIVGSRAANEYAYKKCEELSTAMAEKGYIICSGLARGIDTAAAIGSSKFPGKSIAIMGCGIDRPYPLENTSLRDLIAGNGLVISEYPGDTPPNPGNFPLRNRLIASLSKAVFVPEVHPRSGTMITISLALSLSRDIATIPFYAGEGDYLNNELIKNGAALIDGVEDLELVMSLPKTRK